MPFYSHFSSGTAIAFFVWFFLIFHLLELYSLKKLNLKVDNVGTDESFMGTYVVHILEAIVTSNNKYKCSGT